MYDNKWVSFGLKRTVCAQTLALLAGVEASNYKSVEKVHAALVIPGMHEVIVVMSVVFYLLPYVDQVCIPNSVRSFLFNACRIMLNIGLVKPVHSGKEPRSMTVATKI